MPHIAVMVEVVHWGLQGGLEGVWVILKQPQHNAPHQRGEQWERVAFRLGDKSLLHSQPRQRKQDPGQQVHVDLQRREGKALMGWTHSNASVTASDSWWCAHEEWLFWTTGWSHLTIDVVVISKHQPSSDTGGQKGVRLQTLPLDPLLYGLQSFVCEHKARQVARVGVCGL